MVGLGTGHYLWPGGGAKSKLGGGIENILRLKV